ncbi:hypothetical protein KAR91_70160 [Candidatus Pacearchaeota archaeon]|nr:hypothetical protein [Candidatus Pacearchaeota archaeon]
MSAPTDLYRQLVREDGTPRQGVLVVVIHEDSGVRADKTSDNAGQVIFDTTLWPDGNYRIEYFGDGILKTVFDADGKTKVQEDPQTPWEYEVYIKNPNVITRSQVAFTSLVFKKSDYYPEYEA